MLGIVQNKTHFFWGGLLLAMIVGVGGCESASKTQSGENVNNLSTTTTSSPATAITKTKPKVVASHSVLCNLVEEVAQDKVNLTCLINPDQDPHTYEGKPSDRQAIEQADLVFYAGLNFDPAIASMVEATKTSVPKIALHDQTTSKKLTLVENGKTETDPHVWHDVKNTIGMVQLIETNLAKIDPGHAAEYSKNADAYEARLKALDAWIPKQIATIPQRQRRLVTTHDALGYYANAYGLTVTDTLLGISTEEEPTASKIKSLTNSIKKQGVPVVFAEVTANDKVLKTVANEAKVKISPEELLADGLGKKGTPQGTYIGMMERNTCAIAKGLGGQCTSFNRDR
ncbi:metal ABC transporter solute-binding protein, Zn/Mn family [Scytonema sp. NUACC26]|uniref:metal ABC transporter solute-binding protein, Zn/Mn family n=1 Tax=Scytonema sp. NUACC26 TaxID=3140176 RepID=UPI0034DC5B49